MNKLQTGFLAILFFFPIIQFTYAQDVAPAQNDRLFSFEVADVFFEIDAKSGGRISSLKLNDTEILVLDGSLWGSTFWHAPQNGPDGWGWPPSTVLDSDPYTGGIEGDSVVIESGVDSKYKVSFTKTITASLTDTAITIVYDINNKGTESPSFSPWEVTRVLPSLSFFPSGEGEIIGGLADYAEKIGAVTWYEFKPDQNGGAKFQSDGKHGWFAHVTKDPLLFIKQFEDVPTDGHAPDQREIELWLTGDFAYTELENQGLYRSVQPDQSMSYTVKWYVRSLPEGIDISKGSSELVSFVNSVLGLPDDQPTNIANYTQKDLFVYNNTLYLNGLNEGVSNIKVFDLSGKLVYTNSFTAETTEINFNSLTNGMYIYQLVNQGLTQSGKLIVQ